MTFLDSIFLSSRSPLPPSNPFSISRAIHVSFWLDTHPKDPLRVGHSPELVNFFTPIRKVVTGLPSLDRYFQQHFEVLGTLFGSDLIGHLSRKGHPLSR
jgi:hypothetical protein